MYNFPFLLPELTLAAPERERNLATSKMYELRVQAANLCRILLFLFTHHHVFFFLSDFSGNWCVRKCAETYISKRQLATALNYMHHRVYLSWILS